MSSNEFIEAQIQKKETEIQSLERKLGEAKIYIQALRDVLSAAEKEQAESAAAEGTIREGSAVDQARRAILSAGKPLHLTEILSSLGREVTRETKASLNGSLSAYVRKGEIFTRPKASTFGLLELEDATEDSAPPPQSKEPPPGFGGHVRDIDEEIPF